MSSECRCSGNGDGCASVVLIVICFALLAIHSELEKLVQLIQVMAEAIK